MCVPSQHWTQPTINIFLIIRNPTYCYPSHQGQAVVGDTSVTFFIAGRKKGKQLQIPKRRDHLLWFIKVRTTHQDDGGQQQEAPKIVKPLNYDAQLRNTAANGIKEQCVVLKERKRALEDYSANLTSPSFCFLSESANCQPPQVKHLLPF